MLIGDLARLRSNRRFPRFGVNSALWLPTDLGAALVEWWDASMGITLNGSNVASWTGRKGLVASQATGANQPGYSTTARNSKPGIVFPTGQTTQILTFSPSAFPTDNFGVLVAGWLDGTVSGWRRAFAFGPSSDNDAGFQIIRRGSTAKVSELTIGDAAVDWLGADRAPFASRAGVNRALYVDGTLGISGSAYGATTTTNTFGYIGRGLGFVDNFIGVVQQIVVVNRALTTAERQQLEGWESWYDGKAGANLPAGHPYKTAAPMSTG